MDVPTLRILYGSQTGTAQEVSEGLWRKAKYFGYHAPIQAMDDYPIHNLIEEHFVIFICSTTGQGDQPDNMKKFWKFLLKKSLPCDSLSKIRFAVLGLGDSSYLKFNFCAKKLYRRLLQLGAQPLIEPGYADEQHDLGLDAVVDSWSESLWKNFNYFLPASVNLNVGERILFPARWMARETFDVSESFEYKSENSIPVTCIQNDRITSNDHFQDTRLIKFNAEIPMYFPGDVLWINPKNSVRAIQKFFEIFSTGRTDIISSLVIKLEQIHPEMFVPEALQMPVSFEWLATNYWDLNVGKAFENVPRRYVFDLLSHFTINDLEREKLIEFTTPEGQDDLYSYCNRPKRTILEVLADFPHTTPNIPLDYLFEVFNPIRPRAFSIASSFMKHPSELHILVAVVKYKTKLKEPRIGLCSNWLASLRCGSKVAVSVKPGSFKFPLDNNIPVIMVGPGTGIAPFRSFVQEAFFYKHKPRRLLFFGCRSKKVDFYFREEWSILEETKVVTLHVAFSRDQDHKIYVQHIIEENAEIIHDLIMNQNAMIFVSGNSKNMPDAVKNSIMNDLREYSSMSIEEAEKKINDLVLRGHYQMETWS